MASATPQSGKRSAPSPSSRNASPEVVDPVWLLKAAGVAILVALVCGYLTLCLLFYQGQWQLVLHPDRSKLAPASIGGASIETVRFGVDESGTPQLAGWWIPAPPGGRHSEQTLLYLPSGDGSLADVQPTLAALHSLGVDIFAFNYRGYGQSAPTHPNQRRMAQDSIFALRYLTTSRGIAAEHIVLFGDGVGGALAADLAASQPQVPGIILQSPRADVSTTVRNDPRVRLLPVRLLFHDTFDVAASVVGLKTAKLFLLPEGSSAEPAARSASDPKWTVVLPTDQLNGPASLNAIDRFFNQLSGHSSPPK